MQALSGPRLRNIVARNSVALSVAAMLSWPFALTAQLIHVQTPLHNTRDNFYSGTGVSFGMFFGGNNRIQGLLPNGQTTPNIFFSQGSAAGAIPPFGGYDPNSGLNTGILVNGSNFGFGLGISAGKGNTRSIVSNSPSVTMFNGQSASIFSGETRPFVTGITPVVGNMTGVGLLPLQLPRDLKIPVYIEHPINDSPVVYSTPGSTAAQGALSLAEIARRNSLRHDEEHEQALREIEDLLAKARELAGQGKFGAARVKYSRALRTIGENKANAELREAISGELDAIRDKRR
jgi:hypothetical protein